MKGIERKTGCIGGKGSVTVEAAIVLPLFICVIVVISYIIRIVFIYEVMQHAVNETAGELATLSYLYHVSGLDDAGDTVRNRLDSRAAVFKEHTGAILDGLQNLKHLSGAAAAAGEVASDPAGELKNLGAALAEGAFDDIKTEVFTPLVKLCIGKYLSNGDTDADGRLRKLRVAGGLEGLDFGLSSFFEDENNDIDIVVRYRIELPVSIKGISDLNILQRAAVKGWVGGDMPDYSTGGPEAAAEEGESGEREAAEDIWSLDNFRRGTRIRAIFGANLPSGFPGISKFENGQATLIKSMDLTADYYADPFAAENKIMEYVKGLRKYTGQPEPWGSRNIVIEPGDIHSKVLLLVIPRNTLAPETEQILAQCVSEAAASGIRLEIARYGYKKTGDEGTLEAGTGNEGTGTEETGTEGGAGPEAGK